MNNVSINPVEVAEVLAAARLHSLDAAPHVPVAVLGEEVERLGKRRDEAQNKLIDDISRGIARLFVDADSDFNFGQFLELAGEKIL